MRVRPSTIAWLVLIVSGNGIRGQSADPAAEMVQGIDRFLDAELKRAVLAREQTARPGEQSRDRLRKILGIVDQRISPVEVLQDAAFGKSSLVAETPAYKIYSVRWPVLQGIDAEGLLLEPALPPRAAVVALPDADWSPEQISGVSPGIPAPAQYARTLVEQGCRVLIPVLIDRKDTWSGSAPFRFTNQPHREFIYRMAYQMGRHIIGYEAQKTLAAVDWFERTAPGLPVGVAGYGEGGLIALYSAAVEPRIKAALVSGYFGPRERLFEEPIYRNVWGLLREFGDAELAGMVAPRGLVVEASRGAAVQGPPGESTARRGAAPGFLRSPLVAEVRRELERARRFFDKGGPRMVVSGDGDGPPGSPAAISGFLTLLKVSPQPRPEPARLRIATVPNIESRL
ncbi:MAG TPA: hypothetical protein VMZ52_13760, partial [Bryobacteraceae bacterium]|nr:hypothetical protein [Bryobacteraceae bacterium]